MPSREPGIGDGEDDRPTILVVDDEPDILVALEDLFEDTYHVLAASRAADALDLLDAHPEVLVIVSDQRMPGMTGDVFLTKARAISTAQAILLTGYADLSAVVSALNGGGIAGYASKPWEPALLRSMVAGCVDRRRLARDVEMERALLHGLLDHSPDAIAFKDRDGRFVRLNAVKADSLGTTVPQALGHESADFLPAAIALSLEAADHNVRDSRQPAVAVEDRVVQGTHRWYSVSRVPILDREGHVSHVAVTERDISEERRLEARLRQAEKMQALGTLAGGIAHDFNNLLTAVLGNLELIGRRLGEEPKLHQLLGNAAEAARRGAALTQRLLAFTRQRDLRVETVDVSAVVDGMDHLLLPALGGLVRLDKQLDPEPWPVIIDPDELEFALLNLAINARDAMPRGGRLTIATRKTALPGRGLDGVMSADAGGLPAGDCVVIAVTDTGEGMAPEVVNRIFEPFFTTKEVGKGTGLGLPMVYGLMQQSSGGVHVTSTPGQGTTVELVLPRAVASATPDPVTAVNASPPTTVRLLVVDDDPQVRDVTAGLLTDLGHSVVSVADADTALHQLEERGRFDGVVADITMPGMTGFELAQAIGQRYADLPVLLLTGHTDSASAVGQAVPVLRKPFGQQALAEAVALMLTKQASPVG